MQTETLAQLIAEAALKNAFANHGAGRLRVRSSSVASLKFTWTTCTARRLARD